MPSRESFHNLSTTKRDRFLEAVLALKNTVANPHAPVAEQVSIYDQFVALHGAVMALQLPSGRTANFGHGNDLFLPWHRQYLVDFEQALQQVHSDVTIPYWDWTKRRETRNLLFQPNFLGSLGNRRLHMVEGYFAQTEPVNSPPWWPSGFSGWKVRTEFQDPQWRNLPSHIVESLLRAGDDSRLLPTSSQINRLIARNDRYEGFRVALERGQSTTAARTHNSGHNWVGGHMATGFSPLDPIFFMHHANVDRIWDSWQKRTDRINDYPIELYPGIRRDSLMWPWVGNTQGYQIMNHEIPGLVKDFSNDPPVTPDDVLDVQALNYDYV